MPRNTDFGGTKTKDMKRKLSERIQELCEEQGVDSAANLTEADVKTFLTLTHAEKNMINLIARGYPVRNAAAILRAIEMKLDRSSPRPTPSASDAVPVTVTVNTISEHRPVVTTTSGPVVEPVKN
jgi:hypothetical protein